VARLVADVLAQHANEPDFSVSVLPVSVTYTHRMHFRSDVLVTYQPPIRLTVRVRTLPLLLAVTRRRR
jgi:glycerol-3-phosphate O-acyltransferase/dihydroxyacetone phosphate acyltransferase